MKTLLLFLVLLFADALTGALRNRQEPQDSAKIAVNVQKGLASFYAQKFNGRKTSSGERFYNDSLTAAHKTLPFGTYVRVRNLRNDSVVIVRINDRLPRNSKRSIDLSKKAAKQLNFIAAGVTKVTIEVMKTELANK
jgi:rare lipoprotein A